MQRFMDYCTPILLAEDDENDVFLMRRAFQEVGLPNPLVVVRNGQEAIWYLSGQGIYADRNRFPWPLMLLLDLKMPLMDGFDVLGWLQKGQRRQNLRVVVLTSSKHETDTIRALTLGADAYLVKPHQFYELVGIVRELHLQICEPPRTALLTTARRYEERL
jgi:DNA-binding response OmpR family regulator